MATITIKIPEEITVALEKFKEVCNQYKQGNADIRKVRRYHRRFVKLHKKWIYNL